MPEDIFDQIAPSKQSGDIFDSIQPLKKKLSVVNAQGKSTYLPSEGTSSTPGASPFNRTRDMNQQNIARSAAEQNIAVMPKGFSKRVQPITQDTEQNFNPARGTGKFGSAGTPKVPQQVTKVGGEEVGRQPVFTGGQGLSDVLENTEYGKRVRAVLEDPDAPQWAKALAQLNMNLQGFATPLNVAAGGVGVATLPKAALGAVGVGFGAPMVAEGAKKFAKGEKGAGIADIATGASMAVPGAMEIGKRMLPRVDIDMSMRPSGKDLQPFQRLKKPSPTPAPDVPSALGEGQAPLLDAQGREYVQTGVDAKGKPTFKLKPKEEANAIQKPQAGEILQREQGQVGEAGGGRERVEPVVQGKETPPQGQTQEGQVDTTGIAQRVHEARGASGRIGEITPGQGTTATEMIQKGRDAIAGGADPQQVMSTAKDRGFASGDEIAVLRAHSENLAENTESAVRKFGPGSPEDMTARSQETQWLKDIKPFSTEAHKLMVAHQAETEIGTGDIIEASRRGMPAVFTRLRNAFEADRGREMSPAETKAAEIHATNISDMAEKIKTKRAEVDAEIDNSPKLKKDAKVSLPKDAKGLRNYFAQKYADQPFIVKSMGTEAGVLRKPSPSGFTTPEVRAIWDYAKENYIGLGNVEAKRTYSFNEVVNKTASDLGLTSDQIMKAFTERKTVNTKVDELFKLESDRRRAIQTAKIWMADADKSGFRKFAEKAWRFPSAEAVLGHGGVGMVTHAGPNLFRPTSWKAYWPAFAAQYKMTFNNAFHEKMMQNIEQGPNYAMKVRAGLAIEADKLYDNYQEYGKLLGTLGRKGNQGMDALKLFRDKYFDAEWGKLPKDLQTPDMAKELADWVNGASGKGSLQAKGMDLTKPAGATMFAPSLEASRWKRVLGDPIKTAKTLADWKNATPEEQAIAKLRIRRAAEVTAVYVGTLAANDGILAAQDKKDRINFTDPTKSDWLRHKDGNGRTLDVTGNALAPLKFMAQVVMALDPRPGFASRNYGRNRLESVAQDTLQYTRFKLNPQLGILADVADQKNAVGKLMPFAPNPTMTSDGKFKTPKEQFSWGEYGAEHLPIPIAESIREYYDTLQKEGVSKGQADGILNGILVLPVALTGTRLGHTPKPKQEKSSSSFGKGLGSPVTRPTLGSLRRGG